MEFQKLMFLISYLVKKNYVYCFAESPRTPKVQSSGDDWRSAFDAAANGSLSHSNSTGRSSSANGRSRRYESANGDVGGYGANSGSRRTPNRLPPAPPPGSDSSSSMYRY